MWRMIRPGARIILVNRCGLRLVHEWNPVRCARALGVEFNLLLGQLQ